MERYAIRELNQQTASVLARVQNGETVEITSRGKPIARIVPVHGSGELDDLIAAGWATPATLPRPFPKPMGEVDRTNAASEALIAMRDEERS